MVFMFNVLMMDYLKSCTCFDVGSGMHMFWSRVLSCSFIFDIMFLSLVFQLLDCIVVFFFLGLLRFALLSLQGGCVLPCYLFEGLCFCCYGVIIQLFVILAHF